MRLKFVTQFPFRAVLGAFLWLFFSAAAFTQTNTVTGVVTSAEDGIPLLGVTISVQGTGKGTITDIDGQYAIEVSANSILVFSYIGFADQEVNVGTNTTLNVVLQPDVKKLDEVVVIGYGTNSRRTLTTAVSKLDGETLADNPISNVGEGIKGRIAGTRVFSSNNAPGSDPEIRIRGGSSINKSNAPLVLIDGVELSLSDINPNDIASIEVLKDAASTAIYGSRASNGVVLVTTKRGKLNQAPQITFEATLAQQEFERFYEFMDARQYISAVRPIVATSPSPARNQQSGYSASSGNTESSIYTTRYLQDGESIPAGYESMPDPLDPSKTLIFQNNPAEDLLFRKALWQNYFLVINGGNEQVRYSGSLGYTGDEGIALSSGWNRVSARSNVDANLSKKLKLSTNISMTKSTSLVPYNQQNVISRGLATAATHRVYWADGTPAPGYNATSPAPLWNDYVRRDNREELRLTLGGLLNWEIVDGLHANLATSYYSRNWQRDFFMLAQEFDGSRHAESSFSSDAQSKLEAYLSYEKVFGDFGLSAVAGYSYLDLTFKDVNAEAEGASTDKIQTLNAAPTKTDASSEIHEETLLGYFGRVTLDFRKKYFISGTLRRDGSSRFLQGNQWGIFPAGSLGWRISEEDFMQSFPTVSNLKLRVSYGQTGNNQVGRYDAQGTYSVEGKYDGNPAIRSVQMPNNNLTWETSTQLDAGLDIGIFNDRINVTADYFDKVTNNLLFSKPLPNTSGFSSVETNIGEVRFYGFDLETDALVYKGDHFNWTTGLTWSFVKNLVLKLPDNGRYKNRIGGIVVDPDDPTLDYGGIAEGEPLYRYYGYMVDYIIQTQEQADNANYDEASRGYSPVDGKRVKGRKLPGDYEWVDRNNDGIIDSRDQFELGVTVPHTTGGWNNNFNYGNFSLNVVMDWALGHSINDNSYMRYFMNTFAYNYNLVVQANDTWTPENTGATYARLTANDPGDGSNNFARTSSAFNFKANYLCLREVTLKYQIPEKTFRKIGIKGASVYLSGYNLHYFTSLIGASPEEGAETTYGSGYNNYPAVRKLAAGIKVSL